MTFGGSFVLVAGSTPFDYFSAGFALVVFVVVIALLIAVSRGWRPGRK